MHNYRKFNVGVTLDFGFVKESPNISTYRVGNKSKKYIEDKKVPTWTRLNTLTLLNIKSNQFSVVKNCSLSVLL